MINCRKLVVGCVLSLAAVTPAVAQVSWTDWTSAGTNTASGTLFGGAVDVTFGGEYFFVQTGCGGNFWTNPATYISATVPTAPPACDLVGLFLGGLKTITFSQAVVNPLIAMTSWNDQELGVTFSGPITILSQGPGFWGTGTFSVLGGNTLIGSGEAHGVIQLVVTYTSFSFTDNTENWHGFTIGAQDVAAGVVPEPATYALLTGGLAVLAAVRRRRRTAA